MPTVTRTFTVQAEPDAVLAYLTDFGNATEWDPGTVSCERLDANPLQVGSRFHNVSKIAGITTELEYRIDQLTPGRVVFVGENDSATSTDTVTVRPHAGGAEVTYEAEIHAKGIGKLAEPIMKLLFERIGDKTEEQLTRVLTGLGREG